MRNQEVKKKYVIIKFNIWIIINSRLWLKNKGRMIWVGKWIPEGRYRVIR